MNAIFYCASSCISLLNKPPSMSVSKVFIQILVLCNNVCSYIKHFYIFSIHMRALEGFIFLIKWSINARAVYDGEEKAHGMLLCVSASVRALLKLTPFSSQAACAWTIVVAPLLLLYSCVICHLSWAVNDVLYYHEISGKNQSAIFPQTSYRTSYIHKYVYVCIWIRFFYIDIIQFFSEYWFRVCGVECRCSLYIMIDFSFGLKFFLLRKFHS